MDTDCLIKALQRFISRGGKPNTIISDFGSIFIGAVQELKLQHNGLHQIKMTEFTEQEKIIWKFNPPSSQNMGGSWERLVHVVKRLYSTWVS